MSDSTQNATPTTVKFDRILNFRDVGETINRITAPSSAAASSPSPSGPRLNTGLLYRSARPDNATPSDRSLLIETYKIHTILDLRSTTELLNASQKHSSSPDAVAVAAAQSALVPAPDSVIAQPLKIPGVSYAEINLNGSAFSRALVWKLRWSSISKLVWYMALGYREAGIAILGREVMKPRGLVGLGCDTLDYSGAEIRRVFDVLADAQQYPVLVHCTQGKDRTGLVVLLALMLCGVEVTAIAEDYGMSVKELEPEFNERMREIESIGLDADFAGCPTDFVEKIVAHIDEKYGGVQNYLDGIGVGIEMQKKVTNILIADLDRQRS